VCSPVSVSPRAGPISHRLRPRKESPMEAAVSSRPAAGPAASPLATAQVTCILPVKDMARARRFYEGGVGLEPLGAKPDGKFVYRCGGPGLAPFPREEGTRATHTAASFRVDDIAAAIAALERRGVTFADYDLPRRTTVEHICEL